MHGHFKMKSKLMIIFALSMLFSEYGVNALSFHGPRVYVVTPSSRTIKAEGKPSPFYYHNWMRRVDSGMNTSSTTTTTETSATKPKTPDLIFAEFESAGSKPKSIRKLLEKEKIVPKKTTMNPIYVPDLGTNQISRVVNYGLPVKNNESSTEHIKYGSMSYDDYYENVPAPVYIQSPTTIPPTKTTMTSTPSSINLENIWHVIDSEKSNQYSNKWEEISIESQPGDNIDDQEIDDDSRNDHNENQQTDQDDSYKKDDGERDNTLFDENFALPGFGTNPGNGAENESRAIRTEQNIRFPYINLKPFQIKSSNKPSLNSLSNGKTSNLYTSVNNFYDLKNPVRGEAQDIGPLTPAIDRYNPAQPYLPQQKYGSNLSKQSSSDSVSPKATAKLIPPPPPPPTATGNGFPAPITYESFPPYAPLATDFDTVPAPAPPPPPSSVPMALLPPKNLDMNSDLDTSGPSINDSQPTIDMSYHYKLPPSISDSDSNVPVINTGYQYKPPSMPIPQFYPTPAPVNKPFQGYSYNKPSTDNDMSSLNVGDKPEFHGYHYKKPVLSTPVDNKPPVYGSPPSYGHDELPPATYGHDDAPSDSYEHDVIAPHDHHSEYPDFTYGQKPYGDIKDGYTIKSHGDDMDMKPPSLPTLDSDMNSDTYGHSMDDHGFPSDFPTDFKFHPEFEDHDHDHYHYHTTTTTEMPRVNRFSYYYLGKKLYYLPLYFSVYFIIYVGALIIKAVLRHKIVYPNSWRPNTTTATFFSKRSVDEYLSHENLHDLTKRVTHAIARAAENYMDSHNSKTESS